MTNLTRRIAPRTAFLLLGLAATAALAWRDRDLVNIPILSEYGDPSGSPQSAPNLEPPAELGGVPAQELRAALQELTSAQLAFTERLVELLPDSDGPDAEHPARELVGPGAEYEAARAAAWPAYREAVERFRRRAAELAARDPENGAYEVASAIAALDLALRPSPAEPWLASSGQPPARLAQALTTSDPALLEEGLSLLERALTRPRLHYGTRELFEARWNQVQGLPLEQLNVRLWSVLTLDLPDLMFTKQGVQTLCLLARRPASASGLAVPERALRAARRLALRSGAEARNVIELLVASAELTIADEAGFDLAVARGSVEEAHTYRHELDTLRAHKDRARSFRDVSREELGLLDGLLLPAGGLGHDHALGRRFDHAVLESLTLWACMGLTLALLPLLAGAALRPPSSTSSAALRAPSSTSGAPCPAGWTLADALKVVLPSLGAGAVLLLAVERLHPNAAYGVFWSGELLLAQVAVYALGAPTLLLWLLRREVLRKHGLGWRSPRLARVGLGLLLTGAALSLFWLSPRARTLELPALLCFAAGVVSCLAVSLGSPRADRAHARSIRRYEGRVGLACVGLGLTLLAGVQLTLVAPRRDALTHEVEEQWRRSLHHEAAHWGDGALLKHMHTLLDTAPDAPADLPTWR